MTGAVVSIGLCLLGGTVITAGLMYLAHNAGLFREAPTCETVDDWDDVDYEWRFNAIVRAEEKRERARRAHPSQQRPT